jgi:hypothetical protein
MPYSLRRTVASGIGRPRQMLHALFRPIGPIGDAEVSRRQLSLRKSTIFWVFSLMPASWYVRAHGQSCPWADIWLQAKVPSLTQGVKDTGVLLAAFGMRDAVDQSHNPDAGAPDVDAMMHNGTLVFMDHIRT